MHRLKHLEPVLAEREWLAGPFSVADILMADVLRLVDRFDGLADYPACRAYVACATARPAFVKAYEDQLAHFARRGLHPVSNSIAPGATQAKSRLTAPSQLLSRGASRVVPNLHDRPFAGFQRRISVPDYRAVMRVRNRQIATGRGASGQQQRKSEKSHFGFSTGLRFTLFSPALRRDCPLIRWQFAGP